VIAAEQERFDLVLHALANPTRRDIVRLVLHEERSVSDLARCYPMTFAAVQKHVAILERASLVTKRERGRERLVLGEIEAVREVASVFDQLEATWRARLHRFGDVLAEPEPAPVPVATSRSKPSPKSTFKEGTKR
jgi:DNA-binding transcriptional ArsR family regulator